MDSHIYFSRTDKGREELLGGGRTLKPRQRQVLFLVTDIISIGDLKQKLPSCQELENILTQLWNEGYIDQVTGEAKQGETSPAQAPAPTAPDISAALKVLQGSRLEAARQHACTILAGLVGEQSPIYLQVAAAQDMETFKAAIEHSKKLLSTVASAHQASDFERGVLAILNLPGMDQAPAVPMNPGQLNGIEHAKAQALEIVASLVGERSPVYAKIHDTHNRADFIQAVGAGRKVIAAVASASRAKDFEQQILSMLQK